MSAPIPLMTGTVVPHSPRVLTFEGNPAWNVQADGGSNISPALTD